MSGSNASPAEIRDAMRSDQLNHALMALWNIEGVLALMLDHAALNDPKFPDELAAGLRMTHSEAHRIVAKLEKGASR